MKKLISLVLVLIMVFSLAPAAFAGHTHVFGDWKTHIPASELDAGEERAYCTVKGCNAYEKREVPKLPPIYVANTRDNEKHRSMAVTAALDGKDVTVTNWTVKQMVMQLEQLTDRNFNQAFELKALGIGVGYFGKVTEQTVTLPAELFAKLMEAREDLCLTLTTGTASVALDPENTEALYKAVKEDVALHTKLSGDKLTVELLADGKAASVDMTVLTWCKDSGKYIGTADSELVKGYDRYTDSYTLAYTDCSGSAELSLQSGSAADCPWLEQTQAKWKLRLGDLF